MENKGKFITIEGCEGVGKSTLVEGLKRYFAEREINAVFTREPGGVPLAERLRAIILDKDSPLSAETELLLYAAARAQHTEQLIIPALREGKIVVCDRYSDSTLAYQGYARGLDKSLIERVNAFAERGVTIDATLFLDLDPESGFVRKGGADKGDRLEAAGLEFHKRVYRGFREIAAKYQRVITLAADKSAEDVLNVAIAALQARGIL